MFRLTLALLFSLYAAMAIWGDSPTGDVVVARAESFVPTLPSLGAERRQDGGETGMSDVSEREAVELALAAGASVQPPVDEVEVVAAPEQADTEPGIIRYVQGSRVNLRAGPTTNSAIVGSVSLGERAEVLSDPEASWILIRTDKGTEAWIYGRFLAETPA